MKNRKKINKIFSKKIEKIKKEKKSFCICPLCKSKHMKDIALNKIVKLINEWTVKIE